MVPIAPASGFPGPAMTEEKLADVSSLHDLVVLSLDVGRSLDRRAYHPNYNQFMSVAAGLDGRKDVCHVCLSGMLMSIFDAAVVDPYVDCAPRYLQASGRIRRVTRNRFEALDYVRIGDIPHAVWLFYQDRPDVYDKVVAVNRCVWYRSPDFDFTSWPGFDRFAKDIERNLLPPLKGLGL